VLEAEPPARETSLRQDCTFSDCVGGLRPKQKTRPRKRTGS